MWHSKYHHLEDLESLENALFWIMIFDGFRPSRVGIDFIAALASVAPFLIIGAAYGWFVYLNAKAKTKPSKARRD